MTRVILRVLLSVLLIAEYSLLHAQTFPSFGVEVKVFIAGYSGDAMEPFLSPDGNTLFFNSLNDGVQTRLYYASRVDDSTFIYIGEVIGANEPNNPQLNAVASLDTTGNFVWVSVRDYPTNFDNLHRADFSNGTCTNVNRVHGNFYVYQPGWIVMDAMITYDGSELYYCNAFFDTCIVPCKASLGIAARVNDSTFNTVANSAYILQHVNDTNYCVYAPQLSANGLELYFTRYLIGGLSTEICVSVRATVADTFSSPMVLISEFPNVPEAAGTNPAATLMYYHKKVNGTYTIFLRQRILTGIEEQPAANTVLVFPNPTSQELHIVHMIFPGDRIAIFNTAGELVIEQPAERIIDISCLPAGMYHLRYQSNSISNSSFLISR